MAKGCLSFSDWGNNTIIIQGTNKVKTIHVTKKLGAPTKCPKMLVGYDFHFGISNEEKDLFYSAYEKWKTKNLCGLKFNVVTKNDAYSLPFLNEVINIIAIHEVYKF